MPVALFAGGEASSTTHSGISGAAVTITDDAKQQALTGQTAARTIASINTNVSSDRDGSSALKPIFDAEEIQNDFNIVGKFVQNVGVYLESRAKEVDQAKADAAKEQQLSTNPNLSAEEQQVHRDKYLALNQQARDLANDWGAGGTYRQIATALVAGVSGNVTGASSQFAQNMVVNYVQQQGSGYIGRLVAQGDIQEGDPIHTALHAILGCAGAAASNQGCSSGAMGGAAASVLAGLFNDTRPDETNEEREAKRNIITSLVTGIAAMSDPSGAAAASGAATANVDNNWLATQQIVQANKEFAEAPTYADKIAVAVKWIGISGNQDFLTGKGLLTGLGQGLADSGLSTLDSAAQLMAHPVESVTAMKEFLATTTARQIMGAAADALGTQLDQIATALEQGGDTNAEQLGLSMGLAVSIIVSALAGGQTNTAQVAAELSRMGIDLSSAAIKTAAAGYKAKSVETKLAKLEAVGRDLDVPEAPHVDLPETINPPTKPPVSINSGIPAVSDLQPIEPSAGGYISGGKLNQSGYAITDLTDTEKSLAQNIANGLDTKGTLTEELVESVAARQGLQPLDGGKYGSNNGFDHVYLNKDGQVVILESKQLNGGFALTQGADGVVQMSESWIYKVLGSLDETSPSYAAVFNSGGCKNRVQHGH